MPLSDEASTPRPGRPRSQVSRDAILVAATGLVIEEGYSAASIEKIAQRASVGKQTIYRWWPSKGDLLLEAIASKADLHVPIPDTGDWESDLRRFLDDSFTLGRTPNSPELLGALMVEAQLDARFGERFRTEFLTRRRDALAVLVERARARHELPRWLSVEIVADIVFGVIWYRIIALPRPLDSELVDELTAVLTAHKAPGRPPSRPPRQLKAPIG